MPDSIQNIVNRLMEELVRSVQILGNTLTAVEVQIKQQNRRQYEILDELKAIRNTLTGDENGIRTKINLIIQKLETDATEGIEKKKSLWSLRNGIIILLSNAIVGLIVYLLKS